MISDSQLQRLATFIKAETGIDLENKTNFIESRLDPFFLKNSDIDSNEYIKKAIFDPKGREAEEIINLLTTNHTFFLTEEMFHMKLHYTEIKIDVQESAF